MFTANRLGEINKPGVSIEQGLCIHFYEYWLIFRSIYDIIAIGKRFSMIVFFSYFTFTDFDGNWTTEYLFG